MSGAPEQLGAVRPLRRLGAGAAHFDEAAPLGLLRVILRHSLEPGREALLQGGGLPRQLCPAPRHGRQGVAAKLELDKVRERLRCRECCRLSVARRE